MAATPTGCFKCGRPGHWSRDCPSFKDASKPDNQHKQDYGSTQKWKSDDGSKRTGNKPPAKEAPKKVPRKRPKLTPDLLLSDDGLGYVLEKLPDMVNIRGRGHEVEGLKSLLEAYMHWHSRLLPYFPFDQFVEKVEKMGCTKRVRTCIRDMRDKVANGEELKGAISSQQIGYAGINEDHEPNQEKEGNAVCLEDEGPNEPDVQDDLYEEFYKKATDLAPDPALGSTVQAKPMESPQTNEMSAEQRARMEANKMKALERARARAALAATTEQPS